MKLQQKESIQKKTRKKQKEIQNRWNKQKVKNTLFNLNPNILVIILNVNVLNISLKIKN